MSDEFDEGAHVSISRPGFLWNPKALTLGYPGFSFKTLSRRWPLSLRKHVDPCVKYFYGRCMTNSFEFEADNLPARSQESGSGSRM